MGTRLLLVAFRDSTLDRIVADPPLVWRALEPENPARYVEELRHQALRRRNILIRLFSGRPKEKGPLPPVPDLLLAGIEGEHEDLDKAADGLHFLLTRATCDDNRPVLGFLQEGGTPTGDVEVSEGEPAVIFRSDEARQIAAALRALPHSALEAAFDPPAMKGIYPFDMVHGPKPEDLRYLLEYFDVATRFLEHVVTHEMGFLRYLS